MQYTLTPEQVAVVEHGRDPTRPNLMVIARAGAAKTSTLVEMAQEVKPPALALAFNKSIAVELQKEMPKGIDASTLHSLGYAAARQHLKIKCKVDMGKTFRLFKEAISVYTHKEQEELFSSYGELKQDYSLAKSSGVIGYNLPEKAKPIHTLQEWMEDVSLYNFSLTEQQVLAHMLQSSWDEVEQGIFDFDDMILYPAVMPVNFPFYKTVMVDESQDLSPLNHTLLTKLTKSNRTRLIAVGDPLQAIYGFRGADRRSMDKLQKQYNADVLKLTTTFRCGINIVAAAQWHAPDLRHWDQAADGIVEALPVWDHTNLPESCAIICRNNAPLYNMAMRLIVRDIPVELSGKDITDVIKKNLSGLVKDVSTPREHLLKLINVWAETKKRRIKDQNLVEDQAECMRIFVNRSDDLEGALAAVMQLQEARGSVKLMTGHRAKGLEFDTVFFLDPMLLDPEDEQDQNLRYVIQTRARKALYYVESNCFDPDREEGEPA